MSKIAMTDEERKEHNRETILAKQATYRKTPEYKAKQAARSKTPVGKAKQAARRATPEYKAWQAAYHKTPEYKAWHAAYNAIPEHKAQKAAYNVADYAANPEKYAAQHAAYHVANRDRDNARQAAYSKTPAGKAKQAAFLKTPAGKAMARRRQAKRREMDFEPLNSPFPGSDGHHINVTDVIYVPSSMHRSIAHNVWTGRNMAAINALAYEYLALDPS
jgi:hypothetical protein